MELSVQNHILHKQPLNRIAFNPIHKVVAAIVDASDTICFYHYQQASGSFIEIFQSSSRPSGKKSSLAWSPSGHLLALGSTSL
jgi:WD40 repeat protein